MSKKLLQKCKFLKYIYIWSLKKYYLLYSIEYIFYIYIYILDNNLLFIFKQFLYKFKMNEYFYYVLLL